jgi:tetratricopeptide (TPR) repeat protein
MLLLPSLLAAPQWEPEPALVDSYNQAAAALTSHDYAHALTSARTVLASNPDCGLARLVEGIALTGLGQFDTAVLRLEEAILVLPGHADLHVALAEASFASQNFARAQLAAETALSLDPNSFAAWSAQVRIQLRTTNPKQVQKQLQESPLSKTDKACLLLLVVNPIPAHILARCEAGAITPAQAALIRYARQDKSDALEVAFRSDPQSCIEAMSQYLADIPNLTLASLYRGICYERLHKIQEARVDLEQVFEAKTWISIDEDYGFQGILTSRSELALQEVLRQSGWLLLKLDVQADDLPAARLHLARLAHWAGAEDVVAAGTILVDAAQGHDPMPALNRMLAEWPQSPVLLPTVSMMVATSWEPDEPVAAWLKEKGSWQDRYNLAVLAIKTPARCMAEATPFPEDPEEAKSAFNQLAYLCAAMAGDLPSLDFYLKQAASLESLSHSARLQHSWLLFRAGRLIEAQALVSPTCVWATGTQQEGCLQVQSAIRGSNQEQR